MLCKQSLLTPHSFSTQNLFLLLFPVSNMVSCLFCACWQPFNHRDTGFHFPYHLSLRATSSHCLLRVPASKALTTLTFAATLFSINNPFRLISLSSGESSLQRRSFHAYQTPLLLRTKLQWPEREEGRDLGAKKRRLTAFTAQLLFLKHSYAVNKFLLCVYFMPGTKLGTVLYS